MNLNRHRTDIIHTGLDSVTISKATKCDIEEVKLHLNLTYSNRSTLNIITQNIRSVNCNFDDFTTLIERSQVEWEIIVLTECWLPSSQLLPHYQGYSHLASTRHKTQNEGIVIYHKNHLRCTVEEPVVGNANCVILKIGNETCLITLYRPPSEHNTTTFVTDLDAVLRGLKSFQNLILCGDINIDLSPNTSDPRHFDYLTMLAYHGLLPCHTFSTHGRTCLDHMILKTRLEAHCFVIESSVTDHQCVTLTLYLNLPPDQYQKSQIRIDHGNIAKEFSLINFQPVLECSDPNEATDLLISLISSVVTSNTRMVKIPTRKRTSKPWMTKGIIRCLKNRDNLYKKLKKTLKMLF